MPFQASSDPTSGWDVPNNPAFAPPPGQPPASNSGWSTDNKGAVFLLLSLALHSIIPRLTLASKHSTDVIDFTNDADTDEDLRRAMAASLQDQQSQQTYRPPAPSSTVGVSCSTSVMWWNGAEQMEDTQMQMDPIPSHPTAVDLCGSSPRSPHRPPSGIGSYINVDAERQHMTRLSNRLQEQTPEGQSHVYKLRDRTKLVKPSNTTRTLFEMGRYSKSEKTYGRRGSRLRGRYGSRRGRSLQRGSSWNMVRPAFLDWLVARTEIGTLLTCSYRPAFL